jgi:hypothetical protein
VTDRRDEGRPDDWLFHTLTRIEDQQTRHAGEMRQRLQELTTTLTAHQLDDALVAAQVLELAKRLERTSDAKRHLQTLLLSSGLVAVWEGAKHVLGWK